MLVGSLPLRQGAARFAADPSLARAVAAVLAGAADGVAPGDVAVTARQNALAEHTGQHTCILSAGRPGFLMLR